MVVLQRGACLQSDRTGEWLVEYCLNWALVKHRANQHAVSCSDDGMSAKAHALRHSPSSPPAALSMHVGQELQIF